MGSCFSSPDVVSHAPYPTTLEQFVLFGEGNMERCLAHLKTIAVAEVRSVAGVNQLMGPYVIKGRYGVAGLLLLPCRCGLCRSRGFSGTHRCSAKAPASGTWW